MFHAVVFLMTGVNWNLHLGQGEPPSAPTLAWPVSISVGSLPLTMGFPACRKAFGPLPCPTQTPAPYSYGNEHAVHWDVVGENRGLRGLLCVWGCFSRSRQKNCSVMPGTAWEGSPDNPNLFKLSLLRFCQMTELKQFGRVWCPLFKGTQSMGGAVLPHKQWWSSLPKGATLVCFRLLDRCFFPVQADSLWCGRPLFWESWSWWLRP